jgi:hypothetical protein
MLLRVCPLPTSDENQDGGRAFPCNLLESQLRFAGSGPHSPPRWRNARTPMRFACFHFFRCTDKVKATFAPALRKKSVPGTCRPATFTWPGNQHRLTCRSALTLPPLRHTDGRVHAEPSNNSKNLGRGQFLNCLYYKNPYPHRFSPTPASIEHLLTRKSKSHPTNQLLTELLSTLIFLPRHRFSLVAKTHKHS